MALKTPWPICGTCRHIPPTLSRDTTAITHQLWPNFSDFQTSASKGCHSCTLLYEAVQEPFKSRLETGPIYLERAIIDGNIQVVAVTVDLAASPDHSAWDESLWKRNDQPPSFQYVPIADVKYVTDSKDIPHDARLFKDMISLYAEDDGVFRYIKQSLANCLKNHEYSCNRVIFPLSAIASQRDNIVNVVHGNHGLTTATTRLIYVGSEDPKDPPKVVDGQECLYRGGYLILSYCWGITPKDAPWQLTTKNLPQFSAEVPLSVLPQTLHDAIMWTRKLGERYIWIDSMCILQDSKDDWDREASSMASTYGNATMTLVSASSSAYGGMSDRRNPLRNSAAYIPSQEGSTKFSVYLLPNGQPRDTPLEAPTDSRGWCYQEDILSSRMVKFTQQSVSWQCVGDKSSNPGNRAQCLEQLQKHPPYRWYTLWYRLIERYTNKNLTYSKDKLLAFYGIACAKAGSAYLAGFLKTDPWISLLWCRDENQIRNRPGIRYSDYVAPSWSWASLNAAVLFYEASARHWRQPQLEVSPTDPELLHAEVERASFFDTGTVKGGTIVISAYSAIVRTASVRPFLFNTGQGVHTYGRRNFIDPLTGEALGLIVFDVATEAKDDMLLCCVLLQTSAMGLWEKNGTTGLGLALEVQTTTASGALKCTRVGYAQFTLAFGKIYYKRQLELS